MHFIMEPYRLTEPATDENFTEEAYLAANPDVAKDVRHGVSLSSGRQHFELFGKQEKRHIRLPLSVIEAAKKQKMERIRPMLKKDLPLHECPEHCFDFLSQEMKDRYSISQTEALSSNPYDPNVVALIERHQHGLILDCGAGRRDEYYDHVVNLEVVHYDTTDVVAVGEQLPFVDQSFDAVISLSVLEHVRDPFECAREIARVLKPGGELICSVPFLQPYHGYPHHYYNMTHQGLSNLFAGLLNVDKLEIDERCLPIWSLTWLLRNWADGLDGSAREEFLQLKIADLLQNGDHYLEKAFVTGLPDEKNREMAYATVIFAHK
jgi:SAM-dependent methyltransferase